MKNALTHAAEAPRDDLSKARLSKALGKKEEVSPENFVTYAAQQVLKK